MQPMPSYARRVSADLRKRVPALRRNQTALDPHPHGLGEAIFGRVLGVDIASQQPRNDRLLRSHPVCELGLREAQLFASGRQLSHQLPALELGAMQHREERIFCGAVFDQFGEEVLRLGHVPFSGLLSSQSIP